MYIVYIPYASIITNLYLLLQHILSIIKDMDSEKDSASILCGTSAGASLLTSRRVTEADLNR